MEATTLYDRLGGADGIETVVSHLRASLDACGVDDADADEVISSVRGLEDDVLCR